MKRPRALEPSGIPNVLLTPREGDPALHTCWGLLPDADCRTTFQSRSGFKDLGDSNSTAKQVQYSDVDSWQPLLSELMSHLRRCPYDRLGTGTTPRNRAQYRRTSSPTTLRHYVYQRSTCHFLLNVNDYSKGKKKKKKKTFPQESRICHNKEIFNSLKPETL